jgi:hypothetical protein
MVKNQGIWSTVILPSLITVYMGHGTFIVKPIKWGFFHVRFSILTVRLCKLNTLKSLKWIGDHPSILVYNPTLYGGKPSNLMTTISLEYVRTSYPGTQWWTPKELGFIDGASPWFSLKYGRILWLYPWSAESAKNFGMQSSPNWIWRYVQTPLITQIKEGHCYRRHTYIYICPLDWWFQHASTHPHPKGIKWDRHLIVTV